MYLWKKTNRKFTRQLCVKYHTRANQAKKRLRHKGMFLTRIKALARLGLEDDGSFSTEDIQELLNNHMVV